MTPDDYHRALGPSLTSVGLAKQIEHIHLTVALRLKKIV